MSALEKTENVRPTGLGIRHLQTFFLFLAMLLGFTMRANMSIAIVAMTASRNATGNITESEHPTFDWSHSTQGVILSSFFWGYVILQVPAGELARRYGGKVLVTFSIFVNSLICFFQPVAATYGGWRLVCACRILQGLTQAFIYPSVHHLISQWVPKEEKGLLIISIYSGAPLGIAVQLLLGGLIASALGWPAIFYTNGSIGVIWTVAYIAFGSTSPEQCKFISTPELLYIQKSLGREGELKKYPVPWKKILTCLPFWALIVAHCGETFGFYTLMTEMPSFMSKVLGFQLKNNGLLSFLPYLTIYILSLLMGSLTDLILKKNWLSIRNTRKLFSTIGHWGPSLALILLSFVAHQNRVLAIVMLITAVGLNAAHYSGFMLVHHDLAPNFSSILMGISNFIGNIVSIIAPLVCGFIITDEKDPAEWRKVFLLAAGVFFFTNLFFIIFSTSERQPWNEPKGVDVEMEPLRNEKTIQRA